MTDATPEQSDATDSEAMARLVAGDPKGLEALVERYGNTVLRLLERLVGDRDDALDLCQETFLRVHRYRAEYDPTRPFRIWLFTIAANLGRNVLRARRRFLRIPFTGAEGDGDPASVANFLEAEGVRPDELADANERRAAVRRALEQLSPDLRSAVVLVDLQDLSIKEAAEVLRVPARTVESRLYHARRNLRGRLARWLRASSGAAAPAVMFF